MDQIGPKMDKQGQKGLSQEIILNVVSLGRNQTVNFALILQKSHYSIPLVCTHKNLNISMLQKRPIFNSCCVHTQTNIFKKISLFSSSKNPQYSIPLVSTHPRAPLLGFRPVAPCHSQSAPQNLSQFLFGSFSCSLSLFATHWLHLKIFPQFLFCSLSGSLSHFATHRLHLKTHQTLCHPKSASHKSFSVS